MAFSMILVAISQVILMQTVNGQCVNRLISNCGPLETFLPLEFLPPEVILPNQALFNQVGVPIGWPVVPNCAISELAPLQYPVIPGLVPVLPEPVACVPTIAPTVSPDSNLASNLADVLQLLVVTNLLSSTLPGSCNPSYIPNPYTIGSIGPQKCIY